jgi:hypothetical protein
MTKAPITTRETAKAKDETDKAIERLRGERDAYKKAKEVVALEEIARVRSRVTSDYNSARKDQDSFDAGYQWAHSASYTDLKNVAGQLWIMTERRPGFGTVKQTSADHDVREFQAGAKAFFEKLPKD